MTAANAAATADRQAGSAEHRFFSAMALGVLLLALAGFARTYFLRPFLPPPTPALPTLTPLIHLHGVLFTAWVVFLLIQTRLVAARRTGLHRRLGVAGGLLAFLMVAVGSATAVQGALRGVAPFGIDPRRFLLVPLVALALFALFVTAGLARRRDPQSHKRFMLLATLAALPPAIARWVLLFGLGPPMVFAIATLLLVPLVVFDWRKLARLHPVTLWAGGLLVVSGPLRLLLSRTDSWLRIADLLVGLAK